MADEVSPGEFQVGFWRAGHGGLLSVEENRAHNEQCDGYGSCTWQRSARGPDGACCQGACDPEGNRHDHPVEPPEHRVARERTEDEQERITGRYATGGVVEGPRDRGDDRIPVVLTACPNGQAPEPLTKDDVIAHLKEQTLARKAKANRGQGDLVDEMPNQWRDG